MVFTEVWPKHMFSFIERTKIFRSRRLYSTHTVFLFFFIYKDCVLVLVLWFRCCTRPSSAVASHSSSCQVKMEPPTGLFVVSFETCPHSLGLQTCYLSFLMLMKFPESEVTSSGMVFCLTNSVKPKIFNLQGDKTKTAKSSGSLPGWVFLRKYLYDIWRNAHFYLIILISS